MVGTVRLGSLGERLAEQLRVQIIRGELAEGTHLVEDALAERYDVSRGPVRDALRTLAGEALVVPQRRGYVVRGISQADIAELYEVRTALEMLAVRRLAERGEGELAGTRAELERMREAADDGDWPEYAHRDLDFHGALVAAAGNGRLAAMWSQLRGPFGVMLELTNEQDADLRPSYEDHVAILGALAEGDGARAATMVERHLAGSQERMLQAVQRKR